jgi:hypothetical protein
MSFARCSQYQVACICLLRMWCDMFAGNVLSILVLVAHSNREDLWNSVWSPASANASLSCSLDPGAIARHMAVFTILFVMLQHSSAWLHGPTFTCYRALLTAICCNQGFNNSYSSGFSYTRKPFCYNTQVRFFQKTDHPLLLDWTSSTE